MRIVFLIVGSIVLLTAFGFLVGGGALLWLNTTVADDEGFLSIQSQPVETDSHAIIVKHVNVHVAEWGWWRVSSTDVVTIRVRGFSNSPSKRIFLGIAKESDASTYLAGVAYDEITRLGVSGDPFRGFTFEVERTTHLGGALPSGPTSQTFWTASTHGSGTQTLYWSPEDGSYWIVLMNEDGSADVDVTVGVGVKVPVLSTIAASLLFLGILAVIIGGVLIYLSLRR